MSRVIIDDLWLKNDGEVSPSASAKRSLASAKDPFKANVPERWRTTRYGKGKRWRCRWYMAGPDGVKRQKSKAFIRYSEAEEFAAAMEDDVRRGRYTNPADTQRRFGDVAELWLRTKVDIKASTFNRYRDELRCYVNPKWGDTSLGALTSQGMADWVSELMEGTYPALLPKNREPIPLSPRSIRNIVKVVTAGVLGYAIEQRWIGENVARKAKTPKIIRKDEDMVFLTIPEVEELADTAAKIGTEVDGTLIRFLAYTGCRINEALALQVRDMRLDEGRARISRAWSESKDRRMELATPKNGKPRTIAIPAFIIPAIRQMCSGQADTAYVFRSKRGGHILDHNWRTRVWYPSVQAAGMDEIEGLRIHSLRHTYASIAIANGADVKTLQSQLGHASATETLNTYSALWPERLGEVASAVDQARSAAIVSNRV